MFQSCVQQEEDETDQTEILKLKPDARQGMDAVIWTERPNTPNPTAKDFQAMGWTWYALGYDSGIRRSLVSFDLSSIPQGAKIVNATLSLYYNPTSAEIPSTKGHSIRSGSNRTVLSRIITPWTEDAVTWNTQPAISKDNQIMVKPSDNPEEDYVIDVKDLVEDMVAYPSESFGFFFNLEDEGHYRAMIFASSDHADSDLHPEIEIEYTIRQ
jgi:hypothetical protein